jgi:beta-glucosidase/6-phospho-beta-glucosidase/beta-galactosidase
MIPNPFSSFWMAGYECTDKLNAFGNRVDFLELTGHRQMIEYDYQLLQPFGISSVREGIRWSKVETAPYVYNWLPVKGMIESGKALGIQQVWDLCHFGFPDDLTPLHPMFARRFAALCTAFVACYRSLVPHGSIIITPINEVSFLSWLGGEARGTSPYCINQGWEVKYHLMKAYIEGVYALRRADPNIIILSTEPLANMVPRLFGDDENVIAARNLHTFQYQAMDILTGAMCPELGGSPDCVDILGFNYYFNNQIVVGDWTFLPWLNEIEDPRWRSLRSLLTEAYSRYKKPIALTETSHPGEDRPKWIKMIGEECSAVIEAGIPLYSICLYPIIDRPDWDHLTPWHQSGLWDAAIVEGQPPKRVLYTPYADALVKTQGVVNEALRENNLMVAW